MPIAFRHGSQAFYQQEETCPNCRSEINSANVFDHRLRSSTRNIVVEEDEDTRVARPTASGAPLVNFPLNRRGRRTRKRDVIALLEVEGLFIRALLFTTGKERQRRFHQGFFRWKEAFVHQDGSQRCRASLVIQRAQYFEIAQRLSR